MARALTDLRSLARSHTRMSLRVLAGIAKNSTNDSARVAAAIHLLDRGWGKAPQSHTLDGEGKVTVEIVYRTREPQQSAMIDVTPEVIDVTPKQDDDTT